MRVTDQNNTCRFDTSDTYFTIIPATPQLTSPNGGEFWGAGTNQTITWSTATIYSGATVRLDYSLDSGLTWNIIVASTSNTGSYAWTVPNLQSNVALVRITTVGSATLSDASNAVFTIGYPTPILTAPNSGTFEYSEPVTISWNTASFNSSTVRLEYSVDSGTTWTLISNATTSTGSYSWSIPNITTTKFFIRVMNNLNLAVWDANNTVMTINRPVRLTVLNTPTTLTGCQSFTFTVSRSPYISGSTFIQYSTNGGATWTTATSISSGGSVNQTATWTVPNISSPNTIFNAYNTSTPAYNDTANANTIIVPDYPITVTAPNTSVQLIPGQLFTISWTNTANVSGLFRLQLYNGSTFTSTLATNITGNNWIWTVPNTPGTNWKIRVLDDNANCKYDSSDVAFTILPKTPLMTSPNGGETWWAGETKTITWDNSTFYNTVRIDYSLDNGFTWINITSATANDGSESWLVPWTTPRSLVALVRVSEVANLTLNDVSNAVFTINPAVRVLTPNGGLQLGACTNSSISFEHTPQISTNGWTFRIEYSLNNGINWTTLATSQSPQTTTLTTYNYSIPNSSSTQYIARVSVAQNTSYFDISDSANTIKPAVTIIQPNFGGVLQVGSSYQIKWSSDGISNLYNLYYSTTGAGGPYTTIQLNYNTSTNQFNWTVPNTPSNNCYLIIQDATAACKTDTSNLAFIISSTSSQITVTSPNGGDTLSGCQSYNITWTDAGANGPYNVSYTTDGAATYNTIATNVNATNFSWVVPNTINSSNVLVRVQSAAVPTVFDLSNALFTIQNGRVIAGPDTTICQGQSAQLIAIGGNGIYTWTPAGTLNNAGISNPVATPSVTTTYTATSNNGGCVLSDTARVTVIPGGVVTPAVNISVSPNSGVCSGASVTFTAAPTNGGSTPTYQWKRNGTNVGPNNNTFVTSSIANNDFFTCVMTSSASCVSPTTATSNGLSLTVFPSVTPSISISASATSVCAGTNVIFTATPTNGGGAPVYQWKLNGNNVGANSATYSNNALANNDIVVCELTSSANCATPLTVNSNAIAITVNSFVTPTIGINVASTTVCSGQSVVFSSSITNGGSTPGYQWKKNGSNVGTGLATYTTSTLANNDVITCELTSNATCANPLTVTSNSLAMNVVSSAVPSVTIVSNDTDICAGTTVNFTANAVNGGSSPSYQWKVGSTNVGTNSPSYSSNSLTNGQVVTVVMTSNFACASPTTATSSGITMVVNPTSAPTVSIVASPAGAICNGMSVTFTATATNAGSTPIYQWKLNGNNVGSDVSTYSNSALLNSDIVSCVVTSSSTCASPNTATSNAITMTVNSNVVPTIAISTTNTNVCAGSSVVFTSTITNGGSSPIYQWRRNGTVVGTNAASFSSTTLSDNDVITCRLTSNAACATPDSAVSNAIAMTINAVVAPSVAISTANTVVCAGTSVTFTATPTNGGSNPSYQWKLNGNNVGTNSNSFTTASLANNDAVSVVLTSNETCASPAAATSNTLNMTVNPSVTPSVAISATATNICAGGSITFTAIATNGGSLPAYQWRVNGSPSGTNSNTFTTTSLQNGDVVTCILTSNLSCATTANATSNALTITMNTAVVPSVSIAGNNAICSGALVTFTATPTNGGATPTYQWKVNGVNAGTNAASFTTATLANNDVVSVVLSSNANCASPTSATSNSITMTVTPSATPTVTISANSTNICAGTSVTFTATPTNGGSSPAYQWKVNGINAGTNLATFSSSTLNNNDLVSVVMTSNAACASPASVTSNAIAITVNSLSAPTISISTGATTVCNGANVTFNASVTNAGSSPVYQWRVNGNNVGANLSSFSTTSLVNGDVVSCQFTSTSPCAGTTTVSSNNVTMTVTPSLAPAVSISATSTNICTGASVTFTATPTNGGTTPAYQWKVNGNNVGTNSATFATTTLLNNDVVTAVLTSNATCAVPSSATSNSLTITVGSNATPTIVISTSGTSVCAGSNVTFNANITNGGSNPSYQWKVNGSNAGTNSASFTTNSLANGAVVSCVLTSNASCVTQTTANSNNITMTVSPVVTPSISISATATTICAGASVTFTATPTNGGSTPTYQWKVNGNNTGSNTASFSSASLAGGDIVTCELTSSAACPSVPTATSNAIIMIVNGNVTPSVSIVTSGNNICAGTSITFTATPTNGGATSAYQWKVNGNNAGSNAATFTSTTLANNDVVSVVLTSNASCASPVSATSNSITMVVTPSVVPTISISGSGPVCAGGTVTFNASINNGGAAPAYQWKVNGNNVGTSASSYSSSSLANNDVVSCVLTSNANCASPVSVTSNQITAVINANVTPSVTISTPNTAVCSGSSVTFTATPTNGGAAPAYQWKVNGNDAGTNAATYTTSTLANGDVVTVVLTSNANCLTTTTATSNSLTITTTGGAVTPAISIAASATNICAGSPVTFTATPVNGGSSPVYQWKVNGVGTGTNSPTFVTSGLSNNDVVSCTLTSNAACASPTTANSNTVTIIVTSALQPAVSIAASTPSICTGTAVTVTATATNAGSTPSYQWKVNGVNVGANASTYTSSSFNNSDAVVCVVTSSSQCANGVNVTSNSVTVSVSAVVTPSVSIATPSTTICSGSNVVFTATAINGGSSPAYQWKVNGSNAGSNSSLFSSTSLVFGDVVTCVLTSNAACATVANATSNSITMNVSNSVTPTITVSATPGTSVCAGTPVTFLATATNGGSSPVYQWKVNGVNQGTNTASFTATGLNNGDAITCFFTSSETCASPATVTSTPIGMVVTPIPSAPVATANSPVCEGSVLQLNAPTVSGATYSWSGPNAFVATVEDPAITNPTAANSGTYSVVVSINGCNSAPGTVSVVVNAKPTTPIVTQSGNVLTSSAAAGNQWYLNNNFIANANSQSYTASQEGWYVVVVTGANGCSSSSDSLFVTPVGIVDMEFTELLNVYPNPVADNLNLEISGSVNSTENWTYSLTDIAGRVIDFNHISSLQMHIGMADKAAGVYFINITDGNRHTTFKVLKQE
ncbi:MAG: T9SS type A sorting domain-containing protein [Bacteroidetes bacterium]|nr:T9SS type A sorting domain-containing protein [Bacteroidota bacterium]